MINKKNLLIIYLIFFTACFNNITVSKESEKKFLSLRNAEVNVRQGPAWNYPIKFVYKKKYLPVMLVDTYEIWRKVKDHKNNSGWVHVSKLSKRKTAINIKKFSVLFEKPTIYSKPIAKLEVGKLVLVKKCKNGWCKIFTSEYSGWIKKKFLWGRT